jgi:D-alanyl-D-alanine carboxypeptidase
MRILALGLAGCGPITPEQAAERLEEALSHAVDKKDELHGAVLRVDAPALGLQGVWTAGLAEEAEDRPFVEDSPFVAASVGKLFVAAATLALVERGELELDEPITAWVAPELLAGLPVEGGDGAVQRLTPRMLLSHRSGLPDPFDPRESETVDGAPSVFELMVEDPERSWTREQLLDYTRAHYAPAEEDFQYSDANYELLGLVLEGATGQSFDQVVTDEVIAPLGLQHTWYHALQPPPDGAQPYADVWAGELNLAHRPCMTADGAGGGLATTTEDLRLLTRSLREGAPVQLDTLAQDWTEDALHRGIDYGLGVWRIRPGRLFFLLGKYPDLIGVSGMTGSYLYYVPEWDAVITGSFNQTDWQEKHIDFLLSEVLPALERIE